MLCQQPKEMSNCLPSIYASNKGKYHPIGNVVWQLSGWYESIHTFRIKCAAPSSVSVSPSVCRGSSVFPYLPSKHFARWALWNWGDMLIRPWQRQQQREKRKYTERPTTTVSRRRAVNRVPLASSPPPQTHITIEFPRTTTTTSSPRQTFRVLCMYKCDKYTTNTIRGIRPSF